VCLNKLDDLQLAMVIARLYEGEIDSTPPSLKRLLYEVFKTKLIVNDHEDVFDFNSFNFLITAGNSRL